MYIALGIMIGGIIAGRLLQRYLPVKWISHFTLLSILLLLFLLGISIGGNVQLFSRLSDLGWQALIITACCLAGSICCSVLVTPLIKKSLSSGKEK